MHYYSKESKYKFNRTSLSFSEIKHRCKKAIQNKNYILILFIPIMN